MRVAALLPCSLACLSVACEPEPVVATEADEPAIWAAALSHQRADTSEATPFLVDETVEALTAPFDENDIATQLPNVDRSTVSSFDARAQTVQPLALDDADTNGFTLVTSDDAPIATPDAPVVSLSRAGFGPDEALVYIETFCGNVCASGRIFVVERTGGVWSVIATLDLWQS